MKIGIFGGTFNPIHYGHLRAAEEAREVLSLDRVLFIPSGTPPLKIMDIADAGHRYAMVRLAVSKNKKYKVLDIECAKPGKSYTVRTMEILLRLYQGAELYFILGIDAFLDIPNWWMPEKLVSLVNFAVIFRPESRFADLVSSPYLNVRKQALSKLDRDECKSYKTNMMSGNEIVMLKTTPLAISSTDLRKRLKKGLSIKYLLPENVESYIILNKLYT